MLACRQQTGDVATPCLTHLGGVPVDWTKDAGDFGMSGTSGTYLCALLS